MAAVLQDFFLHFVIAPIVILAPFCITSDPRQPISCSNPEAPACPYEVCLSSFPLKKEVASVGHEEIDRRFAMRLFRLPQQDLFEFLHHSFIREQRHLVTNKDCKGSRR